MDFNFNANNKNNNSHGNGVTAFFFNPAQDPVLKEALKVLYQFSFLSTDTFILRDIDYGK